MCFSEYVLETHLDSVQRRQVKPSFGRLQTLATSHLPMLALSKREDLADTCTYAFLPLCLLIYCIMFLSPLFQILSSAHDHSPLSSTANSTHHIAQSTCKRAVSCSLFSLCPMNLARLHWLSSLADVCGHDWALVDGTQAEGMHTSSKTAPGKPGLPGEHCTELLRRQLYIGDSDLPWWLTW